MNEERKLWEHGMINATREDESSDECTHDCSVRNNHFWKSWALTWITCMTARIPRQWPQIRVQALPQTPKLEALKKKDMDMGRDERAKNIWHRCAELASTKQRMMDAGHELAGCKHYEQMQQHLLRSSASLISKGSCNNAGQR